MAANEEHSALAALERFNVSLRSAILENFPCAFEQYVCISLPGTIIDTRQGGSFLPASSGITADQRNAIQCNEARLVDSMVPLDKIMLGPTGKSVTRSYFTSLDMLVPRKTDVGTFSLGSAINQDPNSGEYKYTQAMDYLRKVAPGISNTELNVKDNADSLVRKGVPRTTVDMYVEKQLAWTGARQRWDAARTMAYEARESSPSLQNAPAFSGRQKELKSAQGELHARWMDWVVNGDKLKVDYAFAVVDRDTIMARIEKAKEATRDAMLTSIDGTDWAEVHFEPSHWATLCRQQATAWKSRHPGNPAHLELQIDNLRAMRESYSAYDTQLAQRINASKSDEPVPAFSFDPFDKDVNFPIRNPPQSKLTLVEAKELNEKAKAAGSTATTAEKERAQQRLQAYEHLDKARTDNEAKTEKTVEDLKRATWTVAILEDQALLKETQKRTFRSRDPASLSKAEQDMRDALEKLYLVEKDLVKSGNSIDKDMPLDVKTRWLEASANLKVAMKKEATDTLSAEGISKLRTSIETRLTSLDGEIDRLESTLRNSSGGAVPGMIIGVNPDDKSIVRSTPDHQSTGADDLESAEVWTKITFDVKSKTDTSKSSEQSKDGKFSVGVKDWLNSVKVESSFSKNHKKVENFMASADIAGSFSAMVVNIKRPWLHAELYQDFDIDLAPGNCLSPGAKIVKHWVNTGDNAYGGKERTNYGKFPAYPTAFIVAANAEFTIQSTESNSEDILKILQTDSSVQASVGSWAIKGTLDANFKTSDKNASQHMEVIAGGLKIGFQAPQIIGWVSEVLPELPRGNVPKFGGLNAAPNMAFRANL